MNRRPMPLAQVTLCVNRASGRGTRVVRVLPWDQAWDWAAAWTSRAQRAGWATAQRSQACAMVPLVPRGQDAPLVVLLDVQPLPHAVSGADLA